MSDYLAIPGIVAFFTIPVFLYFEISLLFSQESFERPIIHGIFFNALLWLIFLTILIASNIIYGIVISIVGGFTFLLSIFGGVILSLLYDGRKTGFILQRKAQKKLAIIEYLETKIRSEGKRPTYFTTAICLLLINLFTWGTALATLLIFKEEVLLFCALLLSVSVILAIILFIISFFRGEKYKEVSVSLIIFSVLFYLVFFSLLDVRILIKHLLS